ncbi:Panacea domain-containing protein [Halomonas sp.]|uniref:Panacea domain-containing protein n=1 Tax=Halomonas sp. TaxID=1486246 RepID=UPI003D0FCCC9
MLISHEREKLINAIIFFATNTHYLGKIKLFKLLYFLDFEHFKATGRSVTELEYYAWKMGPVPTKLFEELEAPEPDLAQALEIDRVPTRYERPMLSFTPRVEFDASHFSKREMRLMERLAREFEDTKAEDMIEATHLENQPWDRVWNQYGGRQEQIPYELAVRDQEREAVLAVARGHREVMGSLR